MGGAPDRVAALGLPPLATAADIARGIGIDEAELAWLTNPSVEGRVRHYRRFTVPKRNGGERAISVPLPRLHEAQRWLLAATVGRVPPHRAAMAFRPGSSIVEHARRHAGSAVVIRIDLRDFFPSIDAPWVAGLFASFGYNPGVAAILALLATEPILPVPHSAPDWRDAGGDLRRLPQGACTSPSISNLVCRHLDERLDHAAGIMGFAYGRYADDLTFSHPASCASVGPLLKMARRTVWEEGFAVNEGKTRVMRPHHRQIVTGLVVNGESTAAPRVSRSDLRRFRAILHRCEVDGFDSVSERLGRDARAYISGYLGYVQMVDAKRAARFRLDHQCCNTSAASRRPNVLPRCERGRFADRHRPAWKVRGTMASKKEPSVAATEQTTDTAVRRLSRQETLDHFDAQARRRLGMSGEDFLRRLDAGEFHDIVDDPISHPGYSYLAMLADDVRPLLASG